MNTTILRRAILSVTDKTGLEELAQALVAAEYELISTGGTGAALAKAGIPFIPIEKVTGFPEMMDGRLKTLHPIIAGGILVNRDVLKDLEELNTINGRLIDVVVVNLYDFNKSPSIKQIDVGGPTMLRAAAKNSDHVAAICDPTDYPRAIAELKQYGEITHQSRLFFGAKVFELTAKYDQAISKWYMERMIGS